MHAKPIAVHRRAPGATRADEDVLRPNASGLARPAGRPCRSLGVTSALSHPVLQRGWGQRGHHVNAREVAGPPGRLGISATSNGENTHHTASGLLSCVTFLQLGPEPEGIHALLALALRGEKHGWPRRAVLIRLCSSILCRL